MNSALARELTRPGAGWLLLASGLLAFTMTILIVGPIPAQARNGWNDFLNFYAGGRLSGTPELYRPADIQKTQLRAAGATSDNLPFTRLPFYAAILSPLARLAFARAYICWQAMNLLALVLFVLWFPDVPRRITAIACLASYPVASAFLNGQDALFLLVFLAAALRLFRTQRHFNAGLVLSLCCIKFHLFLALPILIVRRRLWRLGAGLAVGISILVGLSFAVQGSNWINQYIALLRSPSISPNESLMPNLHGLFYNVPHGSELEALCALAALALCWFAAGHPSPDFSFAATLSAGLLISHHAYAHDAVILIPAVLIMLAASGSLVVRALSLTLLLPPVYVLLKYPEPEPLAAKLAIFAFLAAASIEALLTRLRAPGAALAVTS